MLKNWLKSRETKKKLKEFQNAIKVVESLGYSVVNMFEVGGTMYIQENGKNGKPGVRWKLAADEKKKRSDRS